MDGDVGVGENFLDDLLHFFGEVVGGVEGEFAVHGDVEVDEVVGAGMADADGVTIEHFVHGFDAGLDLFSGASRGDVDEGFDGAKAEPAADGDDNAGDEERGDGIGFLQPGKAWEPV